MMNRKGFARKQLWPNHGIIPAFVWSDCGKIIKNLSQGSWCHSWELNRGPPGYECRKLLNINWRVD
jgi:hypothetical protein